MDPSNLQAFNERLNQWIAQQGFWFQLRYSMSAGGGFSTLVYHAMRIAFRLFLVVCVIAAGFGYFLIKRVQKPAYKSWMTTTLAQQVGATGARIDGFSRTQGQLDIRRLACIGGPDAFFTKLDAYNVRCRMGLLDSFTGIWQAGPLAARQLVIEVKAGANDPDLAARAGKALFREYPTFDFPSIESGDTTIRWGYSPRTFGSIEHSHFNAQRTDGAWHFQFRGGTFSQNWLQGLEIEELKAVCDASGLRIEKGILRSGEGTVILEGVSVTGGEQPVVKGSLQMDRVPLESLLPKRLQGLMEGTISGRFKIGGSTNSSDGMAFTGEVTLGAQDSIVLRDRLYLLRALQVVDGGVNGFRKVQFREGSFSLRSGADKLQVEHVKLKAGDVMTLEGAFRVRPPTQAEVNAAANLRNEDELAPLFSKEGIAEEVSQDEITIQKAAEASGRSAKAPTTGENEFFESFDFFDRERELQRRIAEMQMKSLRYEGGFQITLPSSAFVRAPELRAAYPPDSSTDRISLNVPIKGSIDEITLQQSQELYEKGRRSE
jgi:hypothetical protein